MRFRRAYASIDLDALAHNVVLIKQLVAPAGLCAVVKADGYGHGASAVATVALRAGASSLAVALVEEGVELRERGIEAPILLLSEPPEDAFEAAIEARLTPTLYSREGVAAARRSAHNRGVALAVELKVDTGMHRVGCDPDELSELAVAIAEAPELSLGGLWTHLAVADAQGDPFTAKQLGVLCLCRDELQAIGIEVPRLHAANSAGALTHPEARLDLVRCGLALYGYDPMTGPAPSRAGEGLTPVLSLKAEVHLVRRLPAGARPSYGRRYELGSDSSVATVPLGYADGVPRALFERGGEVLVGGRRRPLAGVVTMDQILVDLGEDASVHPGDEVVLIGRQGSEQITAADWAERLGTIPYEILVGIGPRVPRRLIGERPDSEDYHRPVRQVGLGRNAVLPANNSR